MSKLFIIHRSPRSDRGSSFNKKGFTLTELLIVVSIIVLLLLFLLINLKTQVLRARDAKRKADLSRIQKSFEEYLNDRSRYPAGGNLDRCGERLAPQLIIIPCDPSTGEPYLHVPEDPLSAGYRVCAKLENKNDPDILRIGCHPDNGCGYGAGYNYCLASGVPVSPPGFNPAASPTMTPTPTPSYEGPYACTPSGNCNQYDNPALHGCPQAWAESNCQGLCSNPALRCTD